MTERFCTTCTAVWGGRATCSACGTEGVPFDPAGHGRRLVPGNNSWRSLWRRIQAEPMYDEAARITHEHGSGSAVAVALTLLDLMAGRDPEEENESA